MFTQTNELVSGPIFAKNQNSSLEINLLPFHYHPVYYSSHTNSRGAAAIWPQGSLHHTFYKPRMSHLQMPAAVYAVDLVRAIMLFCPPSIPQ
mmetsp:Transcript_37857/g.55761  ORF Transcript_37857/g.55761 Transcript_37857/m.55761 type:complete len:92 (+) Transcript_37857:410-685(+)